MSFVFYCYLEGYLEVIFFLLYFRNINWFFFILIEKIFKIKNKFYFLNIKRINSGKIESILKYLRKY